MAVEVVQCYWLSVFKQLPAGWQCYYYYHYHFYHYYHHRTWSELAIDVDNDAILLVKEWMHSQEFSQDPMLLLPAAIASKLDPRNITAAPLIDMGEVTIRQFRKTADAVALPPWNLVKAQAYLHEICDRNEKPHDPVVCNLKFLVDYQMKPLARLDSIVVAGEDGPEVRRVRLAALTDAQKRKRVEQHDGLVKKRPAKKPGPAAAASTAAASSSGGAGVEVAAVSAGVAFAPAIVEEAGELGEPVKKEKDKSHGCSKCVYLRRGCSQCREWARVGRRGYYFNGEEVMSGL